MSGLKEQAGTLASSESQIKGGSQVLRLMQMVTQIAGIAATSVGSVHPGSAAYAVGVGQIALWALTKAVNFDGPIGSKISALSSYLNDKEEDWLREHEPEDQEGEQYVEYKQNRCKLISVFQPIHQSVADRHIHENLGGSSGCRD